MKSQQTILSLLISFILIMLALSFLYYSHNSEFMRKLFNRIFSLFQNNKNNSDRNNSQDNNFPNKDFDDNLNLEKLTRYQEHELSRLPTLFYETEKSSWVRLKNQKINNTIGITKNFKIITYNVWFGKHNFENRRKAILEILKQKNSDIVCLQEVTSPFFNFLLENEFIKKNYYISDSYINSYNVVILSKFPTKFYILTLPSKMMRNLILGEIKIEINGLSQNMIFSSTHLESLNNEIYRKNQLEKIFNILNKFKNSMLVGDFNIDDNLQNSEMNYIIPNFLDSWNLWMKKYNLTKEDGYTFYEDKTEPPQRIDRILMNEKSEYILNYLEIIGKDKIDVDNKFNFSTVETPSDHQGIYSEFILKN